MARVGLFKTCSTCGEQKLRTAFYTRGLMCRVCTRAKATAWRMAHLDEVRAYDRARSKAFYVLLQQPHITRKLRAQRKQRLARVRAYKRRRRAEQQASSHGERE